MVDYFFFFFVHIGGNFSVLMTLDWDSLFGLCPCPPSCEACVYYMFGFAKSLL